MNADLAGILRDDLHVPAELIQPDTTLTDAGLDSLAHVELSVILRDRFGIDLSDTQIKASTLAQLEGLIAAERREE